MTALFIASAERRAAMAGASSYLNTASRELLIASMVGGRGAAQAEELAMHSLEMALAKLGYRLVPADEVAA